MRRPSKKPTNVPDMDSAGLRADPSVVLTMRGRAPGSCMRAACKEGSTCSPQPKRPRTGTLGVEASPSKKASPQAAATVYYKDKERREKGEAPVYDAAQRAGTAMPTPSPKEQARRAAGYHKPEQKDGIDPRELPAGTFLCTFEQVNELVQMVDAHNRRCSGTLSFRPNSCTFIGVTAHLRPECSTCGRKS